jgi:hypothetical protein
MINETIQWALIAVLCLIMMGVLRALSLLMPPRPRANAVSGPAIGNRVSKEILSRITSPLQQSGVPDEFMVAFVMESCAGCQRLLAEQTEAHRAGDNGNLVLVAKNPTPNFRRAINESGIPTVFDDGIIWDECGITNTPLVVRMERDGRVAAKRVTAHVAEIAASRT